MTFQKIRQRDFPALKTLTYLNTAGEGICPPCVKEALKEYLINKQSKIDLGEERAEYVEECRRTVAKFIRRRPSEVSFCSSVSEAYNLFATALRLTPNDEVVINDLDFPSGVTPWLLQRPLPGIRLWKSQNGGLELENLAPLLHERTRLVQTSIISFSNGYRIDWKPFYALVREKAPKAIISVDASQALGHCKLDYHDADFIVSCAHKWLLGIHGCCLVGISQAREKELTTHAGGWHHLINMFAKDIFQHPLLKQGVLSYSIGNPIYASIHALNHSLRYLNKIGIARIAEYSDTLLSPLYEGLVDLGLKPLAPLQPSSSAGIIAFEHPKSAVIHTKLKRKKILVACHGNRIRISFHLYNSMEDIQNLFKNLYEILLDI